MVNISSIAGLRGTGGLGVYNASKFALEGIGEALFQEVNPLGIAVTNVEPGPFKTKWAGESASFTQAYHEDYNQTAGVLIDILKSRDGNQPGDPRKGAEAIYALTKIKNPPLHLPLGNMAFEWAVQKAEQIKEEFLSFEYLGRPTDFQ